MDGVAETSSSLLEPVDWFVETDDDSPATVGGRIDESLFPETLRQLHEDLVLEFALEKGGLPVDLVHLETETD